MYGDKKTFNVYDILLNIVTDTPYTKHNFPWETYLDSYEDLRLNVPRTAEHAWNHWNVCGISEGRVIYSKEDIIHNIQIEILKLCINHAITCDWESMCITGDLFTPIDIQDLPATDSVLFQQPDILPYVPMVLYRNNFTYILHTLNNVKDIINRLPINNICNINLSFAPILFLRGHIRDSLTTNCIKTFAEYFKHYLNSEIYIHTWKSKNYKGWDNDRKHPTVPQKNLGDYFDNICTDIIIDNHQPGNSSTLLGNTKAPIDGWKHMWLGQLLGLDKI